MSWFRRNKPKLEEQTEETRKVLTEGVFTKCPECETAPDNYFGKKKSNLPDTNDEASNTPISVRIS